MKTELTHDVFKHAGLNAIVGLEPTTGGGLSVRVQAGVKLIQLHQWLAEKGLQVRATYRSSSSLPHSAGWTVIERSGCVWQLPFMAEIGDATVGSLTSSLSKDSGVGPEDLVGCLYKAIHHVTYVNGSGWALS